MGVEEKLVYEYLRRIPQLWQTSEYLYRLFFITISRFLKEKTYIQLRDYNGEVGFVIGVLAEHDLADIVVVGSKVLFKLKKLG